MGLPGTTSFHRYCISWDSMIRGPPFLGPISLGLHTRIIRCHEASFLCLAPGAEHTNFVGNWQLDTASSPSLDGRPASSGTLTIDYRHKMVHLSETFNFADGGNKAVSMEWKLDHKYHPVTGSGSGEYMAKWEGLNPEIAQAVA